MWEWIKNISFFLFIEEDKEIFKILKGKIIHYHNVWSFACGHEETLNIVQYIQVQAPSNS